MIDPCPLTLEEIDETANIGLVSIIQTRQIVEDFQSLRKKRSTWCSKMAVELEPLHQYTPSRGLPPRLPQEES